MKFTTPAGGLTISQLGRYNIEGNVGAYSVRIFDADGGDDVAKATVNLKGQPAGWVYQSIVGGNVTLKGNHTYYLMTETVGWDKKRNGYINEKWYDGDTAVTASEGITITESEWGNWHAGSLFSVDPTRAGFTQQYGYWEARVKMPAGGIGIWPSFCLYTIGDKKLNEEVDIFEEYGGAFQEDKDGGFGMRNGNWGDGPKEGHANVWPPVSKPWLNWHVYGFLATPTKCGFYVDGQLAGEYDTPTSYLTSPMYMTLEYNNGGFWPLSGLIANSHMDVDWVRVWALSDK
jgi:beta-glucanase (GH16 family)